MKRVFSIFGILLFSVLGVSFSSYSEELKNRSKFKWGEYECQMEWSSLVIKKDDLSLRSPVILAFPSSDYAGKGLSGRILNLAQSSHNEGPSGELIKEDGKMLVRLSGVLQPDSKFELPEGKDAKDIYPEMAMIKYKYECIFNKDGKIDVAGELEFLSDRKWDSLSIDNWIEQIDRLEGEFYNVTMSNNALLSGIIPKENGNIPKTYACGNIKEIKIDHPSGALVFDNFNWSTRFWDKRSWGADKKENHILNIRMVLPVSEKSEILEKGRKFNFKYSIKVPFKSL